MNDITLDSIVISCSTNQKYKVLGVHGNLLWLGFLNSDGESTPNLHRTIEADNSNGWYKLYDETNYSLLTYTYDDVREAYDAGIRRVCYEELNAPYEPTLDEYMAEKYGDRMKAL